MLICCEKCKKSFEVNERHLTSGGVTAVCPHCEHKHRVKRIVIPYAVTGEDDTEPYDVAEIEEKAGSVPHIKDDELSDDVESVESDSEMIVISDKESGNYSDDSDSFEKKAPKGEIKSYHIDERRRGIRGTIMDRLVSVDFLYLVAALVIILGFLFYFIS